MPEGAGPLAGVRSVVLIDRPSREVRVRKVDGLPKRADLVYTHRPIEELPEIVDAARTVGATAVWIQSGRDATGAKDPRGCWFSQQDSDRARGIVEGAGLRYIDSPYIADVARERR